MSPTDACVSTTTTAKRCAFEEDTRTNYVIDRDAESAARVVYNYFDGVKRFTGLNADIIESVDESDSARFSRQELLAPTGWFFLNFIMDPRTELCGFRNFCISNYELMIALIDMCRKHTIDEVLKLPDVLEGVEVYNALYPLFCEQIGR